MADNIEAICKKELTEVIRDEYCNGKTCHLCPVGWNIMAALKR